MIPPTGRCTRTRNIALGNKQSTAETSPCTGTAPLAAAVQVLSDELRDRILIEFVGDHVLSKHYCLEPTWQRLLVRRSRKRGVLQYRAEVPQYREYECPPTTFRRGNICDMRSLWSTS